MPRSMNAQVEFSSNFFSPIAGEEEQTNPGIYGKALAQWVFENLPKHGVKTGKVLPEDWGWVVTVPDNDFFLWIGCSNVDETEGRWRCIVEAEFGWFKKLFRLADPQKARSRAAEGLDRLLRSAEHVKDIQWLA